MPANVATRTIRADTAPIVIDNPLLVEVKNPVFKPEITRDMATPAVRLMMLVRMRTIFSLLVKVVDSVLFWVVAREGNSTIPRWNIVPIQATPPRK